MHHGTRGGKVNENEEIGRNRIVKTTNTGYNTYEVGRKTERGRGDWITSRWASGRE